MSEKFSSNVNLLASCYFNLQIKILIFKYVTTNPLITVCFVYSTFHKPLSKIEVLIALIEGELNIKLDYYQLFIFLMSS